MNICIVERLDRFPNKFFTVVSDSGLLPPAQLSTLRPGNFGMDPVDLFQQLQPLANPIPPAGFALVSTVEDLEGQTRLKEGRSGEARRITMSLLALDLLNATYWMDLRKIETPARAFGDAPTATWVALRKDLPWRQHSTTEPDESSEDVALALLNAHDPSEFNVTLDHSSQ